jgi:Leucine-rich repeat (LRR) protein
MLLTELNIKGGTRVSDLWPLKGMPLTSLDVSKTRVSDLSPVTGAPLKVLSIMDTAVADLSPLEGMPLTILHCNQSRVSDLSPLEGTTLTQLHCGQTQVSALSPLRGLPLTRFSCGHTQISDLSPLAGMKLNELFCESTAVADLSLLKGMPLHRLRCHTTRVSSLSPLKELPLLELWIDFPLYSQADEALLKSLPLKIIGERGHVSHSAAEFWKKIESRRQSAEGFAAQIATLPIKEQVAAVVGKLKELNFDGNEIGHLIEGIEDDAVTIASLELGGWTIDITPLMALTKLKKLTLIGGPFWLDISTVTHLPLEELICTEDIARRNAPVLQGMKTLKKINNRPAVEYLNHLSKETLAPASE